MVPNWLKEDKRGIGQLKEQRRQQGRDIKNFCDNRELNVTVPRPAKEGMVGAAFGGVSENES